MNREPFILSSYHVRIGRTAFKVSLGIACALLVITAFRFLKTRQYTAHLGDMIRAQRSTLSKMRQSAETRPAAEPSADSAGGDALERLQTNLVRTARTANCTIEEFQATPDRSPYLSVFTLDTNHPDWQQIPVHLTLKGSLSATLATVDSLRSGGIPVEPDSLEITRQSITEQGVAEVSLRLGFRVLVRAGGRA